MLDSPSSIQTTKEHLTIKSEFFGPVGNALSSIVVGKQMILTVITILLFAGSPSSISGLVIPVLVRKSVDGMFERRSGLHVFHEVPKAAPTVTDFNPTSSVMSITERQGIIATAKDTLPNSVFERIEMLQSISSLSSWQHGMQYSTLRNRMQDEKMIRSAWKHAEMDGNDPSRFFQKKYQTEANVQQLDNLQRFDGGGGTLRMDFTDVKFGEGITWDTHVAIDPDRCYGVNPNDINVYELMKFGAYARDTLQMRQYTSGGTYTS